MGRKKRTTDDEQQELIDVQPENNKELLRAGRAYNKLRDTHASERDSFRKKELAALEKFLAAIKEAGVNPRADGSYRFTADGELIIVTPKMPKVRMEPIAELGALEEEEEEEAEEEEE